MMSVTTRYGAGGVVTPIAYLTSTALLSFLKQPAIVAGFVSARLLPTTTMMLNSLIIPINAALMITLTLDDVSSYRPGNY